MSNNIYDILKKFNNLESVKNTLTEGKKVCKDCGEVKCKCIDESKGSKPDFLDMDKDGDKKEPMKKAAKEKSKGAVAEAVARVEQQLAEKYQGFKKSVTESEVEESGLQAYLGKKKYGEQGMKALQKAGRDGASKEKMAKIRARHDKMDEDNSGTVPPKHYGGEGPTGAAFDLYMQQRKEQLATQRPKNEDMLSPGQKKIARMSPPADKIDAGDLAKLRTDKKGMKKEGNAFSGAVAKAKASGQDEFSVDGKEYKVQEGFPTVSDAQKSHKEQTGKTTHGTKVKTATGIRHTRDYDADQASGDRGRPKKDKFAK